MKTAAIIFDWDGTLIDIDEREAFCIDQALRSVGLASLGYEDFVKEYYSNPYVEAGARMLLRRLIADYEVAEKAVEVYSSRFSETIELTRLQKEALTTLEALKHKNLPIAVATLRRSRSLVEQEMAYLQISGFIDAVVTREDLSVMLQPGRVFDTIAAARAEQFLKALSLLHLQPSEAVVVGDAWWDIRGAKTIEAISAWIKTGLGAYTDFSSEQPDLTLNSLKDILAAV